MWVEFVVGYHPCSEGFSLGSLGFPPSTKTNTFKFDFDLEYTASQAYSFKHYRV